MITEKNIDDTLRLAKRWGIKITEDEAGSCFKMYMVSGSYTNSTLSEYVHRMFGYRQEEK